MYEGEPLARLTNIGSVQDLAAVLSPGEPLVDVIALESHLTRQHVLDLYRIAAGLDGAESELVLWLLRRHQIENLKIIIRSSANKIGSVETSRLLVDLLPKMQLPVEPMLNAPGMNALLRLIPEKRLLKGSLTGLADFESSGRPFLIEAGIDRAYFLELDRLCSVIQDESAEPIRRLFRMEYDIANVMGVLRGHFNYSIPFAKIRPYLAPTGFVSMSALENMPHAADLPAATVHIPAPLLAGKIPPLEGDEAETAMWSKLTLTANQVYYNSVVDFASVVAFYYIKRVELANLIRISACLRYGERGEAVRQKLIGLKPIPAGVK